MADYNNWISADAWPPGTSADKYNIYWAGQPRDFHWLPTGSKPRKKSQFFTFWSWSRILWMRWNQSDSLTLRFENKKRDSGNVNWWVSVSSLCVLWSLATEERDQVHLVMSTALVRLRVSVVKNSVRGFPSLSDTHSNTSSYLTWESTALPYSHIHCHYALQANSKITVMCTVMLVRLQCWWWIFICESESIVILDTSGHQWSPLTQYLPIADLVNQYVICTNTTILFPTKSKIAYLTFMRDFAYSIFQSLVSKVVWQLQRILCNISP